MSYAWQEMHVRAAQRPHLAAAAQYITVHRRKGVWPEGRPHAPAFCRGGHERRKEDLRASRASPLPMSLLWFFRAVLGVES